MKDKDVPNEDHGVQEEQPLHGEQVSHDDIQMTNCPRKRSDKIADDDRNLDDQIPTNAVPDHWGEELIDQRSIVVGSLKRYDQEE